MNQKRLTNLLKFILFLSIGIFLIWLSVHNLTAKDKQDIGSALQRTNYTWLILSMAISLLSHVSRAIRWNMLLEPLGFKPKTSNSFFAVMIGYMANYAVPRLGEVTRPGILTKYEKVPFTESFGTVVVERIVDVLCFLIIAFIVILLQFQKTANYLRENIYPMIAAKFSAHGLLTYIFIGAVVIIGIVLAALWKKIMNKLGNKAKNFINGFIEGLKAIGKVKSPWLFIAHSVFIWFIYYITFHMCFYCLDETKNLSYGAGLTAFLISTLAIMVTPGGLGVVPIAIASVLAIYNIDFSIGTAMGWLAWLTQFISILLVGLLSLVLLPVLNTNKYESTNREAQLDKSEHYS